MDLITYSLSKKIAASAVSGVKSMSVEGQTLKIETNNSGTLTMTFPTPKDGISVVDIDVNAKNQIVFTMSDGTEHISGVIPTVKGDKGDPFKYSDFTPEQLEALKGEDGFSPAITENANNSDSIYKLDVTTADGTFTTPNLKGANGSGGTSNISLDDTLTDPTKAANAKAVGDKISELKGDLSQLSKEIDDCIKTTSTAEVGQTIVVKTVDETGKPTEFEMESVADEMDALVSLSECGILIPVYQNGTFYTDGNGFIYTL